jgi:hypothetical protein
VAADALADVDFAGRAYAVYGGIYTAAAAANTIVLPPRSFGFGASKVERPIAMTSSAPPSPLLAR